MTTPRAWPINPNPAKESDDGQADRTIRVWPEGALPTEPTEEMRVAAENWIGCLGESVAARREQEYLYRLQSAPEIRDIAQRIVLLAHEHGVSSPATYRAIAFLVTICHPVVLAMLLAGAPTTDEAKARRQRKGGRR